MGSIRLLALTLGALGVATVGTPAVGSLLGPGVPLARVYDRVFEVTLVVALVLAWRPLDLGDRTTLGFRAPRPGRALAQGIMAGVTGLGVALALCWALGALAPGLRYPPLKTMGKTALGLAAAVLVGVGEESLFRGVLLRRATLDFGRAPALVTITAIYAVVHAIRTGGADTLAGPWAGWERTLGLFAPLGQPTSWPSIAGLCGLGGLLAWCRLRSGSLWFGIGIHAGWVAVFRVGRLFFALAPTPVWLTGPGWPPLIGGAAGWVALVVTAVVAVMLLSGPTTRAARTPVG